MDCEAARAFQLISNYYFDSTALDRLLVTILMIFPEEVILSNICTLVLEQIIISKEQPTNSNSCRSNIRIVRKFLEFHHSIFRGHGSATIFGGLFDCLPF